MELIDYFLATHSDIPMIVDQRIIFSDSLVGKQDVAVETHLRKSLTGYFEKELNKNYIVWYATVNGKVASIGGLGIRVQPGNIKNPSGVWGYIMSIYTVPEHRRKGLSKNILNRLIESAREMGVTAFELHATKEGEPLYIQSGFEIHQEPTYRKFTQKT
ncbi:MAG: acetyltransferase [Bacteroidetes bacterium]|nr:acetyltransferase [Bacteroidota bacterium]